MCVRTATTPVGSGHTCVCGVHSTAEELFAEGCASRRPSRMRQLLLHTLVADATGTESDYLLVCLLGVTDSIDVLKPDGARLILKKRPGETVRDLKRRVAAAVELFVQDASDALENDAVVGKPGDFFRPSGFSTACCATSGLRVPARPVAPRLY